MEQNTPQSQAATVNTGKKIGIIALVCFIISMVCVFALAPGIGLIAGFLLILIALVLSIIAIVKGGKVIGIITLCLAVLIGGPLGAVKSCASMVDTLNDPVFQNKVMEKAMSDPALTEKIQEAQAQVSAAMNNPAVKRQLELTNELQAAMMANDTEKVQAIQKEMEENAAKISQ